ncbi:hypothetical protein DL764_007090 [Monosporascus ibericus]|uniref:Uncharacterized protein n=1 Tax=Monosporascus ibericus TaxID=155417 RepID=A0A4Q4T5B0_9PEZI|nr:hypothetical protein DL764_007090 [Monosporascus ibericus]
MHRDLLWKEDRPCPPKQVDVVRYLEAADNSCQAPSWTWASQPRRIWHPLILYRELFDFGVPEDPEKEYDNIQGSTTLSGLNPFGAVKGGSLTFTGRIMALPEELEVYKREVGYGQFENLEAYVGEALVATVLLDWSIVDLPSNFARGFSLALIGSCRPRHCAVANESDPASTRTEPLGNGEETVIDKDSIRTVKGYGSSIKPGAGCFTTADKSVSSTDFQSIQSLGENPSSDNESQGDWISVASEEEAERFAYGLVIYPSASKPGKYFRAGLFSSNPETGGGLQYFRGRDSSTVEII